MSSHRIFRRRRVVAPGMALLLGAGVVLATALPAVAADAVAPVALPATLTPATPEGNNNWRSHTADSEPLRHRRRRVDKFQYSLDGGLTYVDVQVTDAPAATATAVISQEGNTTVRYRAVDSIRKHLTGRDHEHDPEPGVGCRRDRDPPVEHRRAQRG